MIKKWKKIDNNTYINELTGKVLIITKDIIGSCFKVNYVGDRQALVYKCYRTIKETRKQANKYMKLHTFV